MLEAEKAHEFDGFSLAAASGAKPCRIDQRLFLQFVSALAKLGQSARATPTSLTGAVLQAWFARSFPRIRKPTLIAPTRLISHPGVQAFAAALSEECLLDAAYWLSSAYAKLLGRDQRRALSMYFTPPSLVAHVLGDLASRGVQFDSEQFLDPACGGAAFLVPIAFQMRQKLRNRMPAAAVIAHIQSHLHGIDLDETLCTLSKELLRAVLYNEIATCGIEPTFSIRAGNSLADDKDLFGTADVVVCNPPYRKMTAEEVAASKRGFQHVLSPQPNLYGLFIALSLQILRNGGFCAVVTPTSYLSGHSFTTLRAFLAKVAHVESIGIVGEKQGVFLDVQQETAVTVFRKCDAHARAKKTEISLISASGRRSPVGACVVPQHGTAWPIPRVAADNSLITQSSKLQSRLANYGYGARVGNYVWNRDQRKAYSSANVARRYNRGALPLLWSSDIKCGMPVHFDGIKRRRGERLFVVVRDPTHSSVIRKPCVLLQRVTSNEQPRRLVAAPVTAAFFRKYRGFISENHTIVLMPLGSRPALTPRRLAELLGCDQIDRLFRSISGATNVSIFELNQLPLPDPEELKRCLARGLSMQEAVTEIFGVLGQRCDI